MCASFPCRVKLRPQTFDVPQICRQDRKCGPICALQAIRESDPPNDCRNIRRWRLQSLYPQCASCHSLTWCCYAGGRLSRTVVYEDYAACWRCGVRDSGASPRHRSPWSHTSEDSSTLTWNGTTLLRMFSAQQCQRAQVTYRHACRDVAASWKCVGPVELPALRVLRSQPKVSACIS